MAYLAALLNRSWVPHDEGTIAQAAERVLLGELPHRDFMDAYTGGLSFLHAAAFEVFGLNLLAPRLLLLVFSLLWIPAIYLIARRFLRPVSASGLTAVAVAWSIPNYVAAVPSWYNLFFATFGTVALLRFLDNRRYRWLMMAGVCGGLSVLVKITGIFFVAAGLLFLAYLAASSSVAEPDCADRRLPVMPMFITVSLSCLVLLLLATVWARLDPATGFQFVFPTVLLVAFILRVSWSPKGFERSEIGRDRLALSVPVFIGGVCLPLIVFLVPFVSAGAVHELFLGVFVLPARRAEFAAMSPPMLTYAIPGLIGVIGLAWLPKERYKWAPWAAAACLAVFMFSPITLFAAILSAIPAVVAIGIGMMWSRTRHEHRSRRHCDRVMVLLCVVALCGLVQFPYSTPIYFMYIAPLVLLALAAICSLGTTRPRILPRWVLLGILLPLGLVANRTMFDFPSHSEPLRLERGGLRVTESDKATYERVAYLLDRYSHGGHTYAGPDAPEVYFLSGLRNPTPYLFEFFASKETFERTVLAALDSVGVTAVVVNQQPEFSPQMSAGLKSELEARFPRSEEVDRFLVRWRE